MSYPAVVGPRPGAEVEQYKPPGLPAPADWLDAPAVPGLAPLAEEWQRRVAIFEAALRREPEVREEFEAEDRTYDEALRAAYAADEDPDAIDPPTSPDDRALSVRDARAHVAAAHASLVACVKQAKRTIAEHLDAWSADLARTAAEHDGEAAEADQERVEAERRARKAKARAGYTRRVGDWLVKAGTSDTFTNRPPSNKRRVKTGVPAVETPADELLRITNRNQSAPFERSDHSVSAEHSSVEEAHVAARANHLRDKEFMEQMDAKERAERDERDRRHRSFIAEQDARRAEQTARTAADQARAARAAADTDEYTKDTYR